MCISFMVWYLSTVYSLVYNILKLCILAYIVILIFIGHGSNPDDATQMPPSSHRKAGIPQSCDQWIRYRHTTTSVTEKYDNLLDFCT